MTKRLALLLLPLGTALMAWGLTLSVSVLPDAAPIVNVGDITTANCADCHLTDSKIWHVTPHNLRLASTQPTPMACIGCHSDDCTGSNTPIAQTHSRIQLMRSEIEPIYTEYQPADPEYAIAQQVDVILRLIEADNRWGFHSSTYIDTQLDDAEALLAMLTAPGR